MAGKRGEPVVIDRPVRADAGEIGKGLPAEENDAPIPVGPGDAFLGHEWELGGNVSIEPANDLRVDGGSILFDDDDVPKHSRILS